jgi:hypothetical protein
VRSAGAEFARPAAGTAVTLMIAVAVDKRRDRRHARVLSGKCRIGRHSLLDGERIGGSSSPSK